MNRRVILPYLTVVASLLAAGCGDSNHTGTPIPLLPTVGNTATPIKHVVVIFGENISYDHYFGTYPKAANLSGETAFSASASTPANNNLSNPLDPTNGFAPLTGVDLLNSNPNGPTGSGAAFNGANSANPFRLAPSQAATTDQGHAPKPEQMAYNNGLVDQFPGSTGNAGPPPLATGESPATATKGIVMGYFDGNTVTALWNYAQNFALNDNSWTSQFGPSTPGAINLISGQTNGFSASIGVIPPDGDTSGTLHPSHEVPDGNGGYTMVGDADPLGDVCSTAPDQVTMAGKNIGDLLNAQNITWGWFEGGFDLTVTNANGTSGCNRLTNPTVPNFAYASTDYIPHHQPFQYYKSTANPKHARPSAVSAIGSTYEADGKTLDPANHQYDTHDFFDALKVGGLPAVTFLKAPAYQDAHPGNSDPIDEQNFVVSVINALQASSAWSSTAVIIAYDDSDGWYDHQMPPIVNPSSSPFVDVLNGTACLTGAQQGTAPPTAPLAGNDGNPALGRCGYGTRLPLLVISPYAKTNYVDHTLTDQASVLRFIEDNWLSGQRVQSAGSYDNIAGPINNMFDFTKKVSSSSVPTVYLNPYTGVRTSGAQQ